MLKVLLVDDELGIRTSITDLLTLQGYKVCAAASGADGMALLSCEKPDLVILDIKIPGEKGLSLLHKMHKESPSTPIVLFSGFISAEIEKEAFEAGAAEVILKGLAMTGLVEKIKKILTVKEKLANRKVASKEETVLIVDDEEAIRTFLNDFFSAAGFKTFQAARGEEALKIVKEKNPSVVLLDITMPGMNGLETLKKIREINPEIGVVMATSVQDEQVAAEAARLGSYHYVLKPFDLAYLKLVVITRLLIAS